MAGTIDVEHDGLFLKHVLEDRGYPEIATIIKRAFDSVIPRKAIDFRTNVGRVIQQCLNMHGVPMMRTKYAGEPFGAGLPGGAFVLMVCYGSHDGKLKGVWFKGVPPEDLDMLAAKKDGYMLMLRKYGQTMPMHPQATALGASLQSIETMMQDALADEEKAVPFYETLLNGIKGTRGLIPKTETDKDRYLFAMENLVGAILIDEGKHRDRIKNMLAAIMELEAVVEVERVTGQKQPLRPLERV